jgi:prephenate dehydrogenase
VCLNAVSQPPVFDNVAIVGLGLIGGSIALAIREHSPATRIVAVDRPAVLAHALGSGAIYRGAQSIGDIGTPDLVVLAAPVRQNLELLAEVAQHVPAATLITDVGGTKRDIVAAARRLPAPAIFIGGHPIGGAERGGFGFARPDLFAGRPWIITPDEVSPTDAVDTLQAFVASLGARPTIMAADEHDRLMAFLSHLPQLAASALMDVTGSAAGTAGLRVSGRGLMDTTRLASSPASIWRDICASNAEPIREALDLLIDRLSALRGDLEGGEQIDAVFGRAAHWRSELMKGRD